MLRLVLSVLFLAVCVFDFDVASADAPPGVLRTESALLRPATAPDRSDGILRVQISVAGPDFSTAASAPGLYIHVRDNSGFDVSIPLASCNRRGAGVSCRDPEQRARVNIVPRSMDGRDGWRVRVRAKGLSQRATGTALPTAPTMVSVDGLWRDAPVNMLRTCEAAETTLRCVASRPPNIVLVMTDDQRWDSLDVMPGVAELAARGVSFANSFVTTPLCAPSRASLLTGLYAHNHRVHTLGLPDGGAAKFVGADSSTIATWLQAVGYRTGMFGKYLNGYADVGPPKRPAWYIPPGWDFWHAFAVPHYFNFDLVGRDGLLEHHGEDAADYSTDVTAAQALAFVDSALADGVPFFLLYAPFAPHVDAPNLFPVAAPRHDGMFAGIPGARPPNFNEADVSDKPTWIQSLPLIDDFTAIIMDGNRQIGFETLQSVDEAVTALLTHLENAGASDTTIVAFTSDNGFEHGEHRDFGKQCPYEECIRVPLVVRAPGLVASEGMIESSLVENVDLAPTLAALAGVAPPTPVDGRSLVPLLMGTAMPWRTEVLLELWPSLEHPELFGVRTEQWKYVEYPATAQVELYDLIADPYELENRSGDPAYAAQRAAMRALAVANSTAPAGQTTP